MIKLLNVSFIGLLAIAAFSTSASAWWKQVTVDSTWAEIKATSRLRVKYPKVQIEGTFTFVSVDGLCSDGVQLRTIKPVSTCVQNCTPADHKILSTPIEYSYEHCARGNESSCSRWETLHARLPLSYLAWVVSATPTETLQFLKYYDIKTCE